jgi:flagellin-specific chaperone FliS
MSYSTYSKNQKNHIANPKDQMIMFFNRCSELLDLAEMHYTHKNFEQFAHRLDQLIQAFSLLPSLFHIEGHTSWNEYCENVLRTIASYAVSIDPQKKEVLKKNFTEMAEMFKEIR